MAGWNQAAAALPADVVDRNDRFNATCATGKCQGLPTHVIAWDYVTGRGGRVGHATRHVCTSHAEKFAKKNDIEISGVYDEPRSFVSTAVEQMTGGDAPVDQVRVHRSAHGMQWYIERRRSGSTSLLAITQQWLAGVRGDATLTEAIAEAEAVLALDRLVPAAQWQPEGDQATVRVIAAEQAPEWADRPWALTVYREQGGMWILDRRLDRRFPSISKHLGFHNMTVERALRVANQVLDEQGWVGITAWAATATEPLTVTRFAWHPAQIPSQEETQ